MGGDQPVLLPILMPRPPRVLCSSLKCHQAHFIRLKRSSALKRLSDACELKLQTSSDDPVDKGLGPVNTFSNLEGFMLYPQSQHRSKYCLLLALGISLISTSAFADPLKVTAIEWVQGRPDIPHIAVNGQSTMLQAIAEGGTCSPNYRYRWDWNGDGDYDDPNETFSDASSANYSNFFAPLPLEITFPDAQGDRIYYPKVQVECGDEVATSIMPVLIRVNRMCPGYFNDSRNPNCGEDGNINLTRQVYADRAVDRGLWYLFLTTLHSPTDAYGHNTHTCTVPGIKKLYSTGHALNAFLRRGHGHGEGRESDPYYRHFTQCGLHAFMDTMLLTDVDFDDNDAIGSNGQGIYFSPQWGISSSHWSSYESTAWAEPVANFGDPNYISQAGSAATFNRSLRDIGQDLADGLVRCMTTNGGWFYSCGGASTVDASTTGWAPEALRLLERKYGVETYDWARTQHRSWLSSYCPSGICSYHGGGPKLAGNALVGYGWTENQVYSGAGQSLASVNAAQNWYQNDSSHWGLYFIYATTKGLRSFVPEIKYLPNGTDWSKSFTDFFITGKDPIHSDGGARQNADGSWGWSGSWTWSGSIGNNERTGLTIQIVQTWLEVWAYARAFPEFISPGAEVTFDHSWSYTLDPSVNVFNYKWNVIDYVDPALPQCQNGDGGCTDRNGDGDCDDAGEMCNEDLNGNGVVDEAEIVWDFVTIDPFEQFTFSYQPDIDWGEDRRYNVRLRVTDTRGRHVDDTDSVRVVVSKSNNPPTIVAHPLGPTVVYSGYENTEIVLDGRGSYDVDADQAPFPGDNTRPPGIPDRITSIHFDLNLDGDFDDEGEDGTDNIVRFTLNAESAIGDLISIPIRVCDDGQWTNTCLDGLDADDCSRCSIGSASVRLLTNTDPPDIDLCPGENPPEDDCSTREVEGDNTGLGGVGIDLSDTSDPEGVLGVTYHYELIQGQGEIDTDPAYDDIPNDMGPTFTYYPEGEGLRTDIVKVTATDGGGLSSERNIEFLIPNINPVAGWDQLIITPRPPLITASEAIPEGNGRYRITITAQTRHGVEATLIPTASDVADEFTTYISMDGPDGWDYRLTEAELPQGVTVELPDGYRSTAYVWAVDDDQGESAPRAPLEIDVPFKSDRLVYTFDLNNDGIPEADQSAQSTYTFTYNGPADEIPTRVTVTDESGQSSTVDVNVPVANRPPVFEQHVTLRDEWTVTFITSAVDPDEDTVRYTFDAQDGSDTQTNRGGIFVHTFPLDQFVNYQPTVTAWDGRGGEVTHTFNIGFDPEVNLPPVIDSVTPTVRPGGQVSVSVEARDPEGEPLTVTLNWGDGTPAARVFGGITERDLPFGPVDYALTVTARDPSGQEAVAQATVNLIDNPTIISRVQQNRLADGARLFTVQATDLDTSSLRYYWDYENDGVWDDQDNVDNSSSHVFPSADEYVTRIGVLDPWSGVIEETTVIVGQELPPVITAVELSYAPRGRTHIAVEAHDPEGGPLSYEIIWGDEPAPNEGEEVPYQSLATGEGDHDYAFNNNVAYSGRVRVTDQRGLTTEESFEAVIVDSLTEIQEVSITQTVGGEVMVRVTAEDVDSPEGLSYDFDFESDATWEMEGQLDPIAFHTYPEANTYPITLRVTDPWSGASVSETLEYELTPWNQSAIAEDHVLGEEGRCVVFRVDPALVTLEAKVDPTACDDAVADGMDWLWDFGDGFTRWGAEAGHRYADDGIYLVTVSNQDERRPRVSQIQAHISNLAPTFNSDPVEVAEPGAPYVYEVRLEDPGVTDALRLSLGEGTPVGMEVVQGSSDRVWSLMWEVPANQPEGPLRISLIAEDGHMVSEAGAPPTWVADGGRTEQRYWLSVRVGGSTEGDQVDNGDNTMDATGDRDVNTTGEYQPSEDQSFAGSGYSASSCAQQGAHSSTMPILFLLLGMIVGVKRRDQA